MDSPLRVLLIDDDRDDFLLTRELLGEAFGERITLQWENHYASGFEALKRDDVDVCLLDYRLGPKTGIDLLAEATAADLKTPIILLTGQGEREIDLLAMKAGAVDYLTKDQLDAGQLERTIRHALERHRDRSALRQANEMLELRVQQRTHELEEANRALTLADRRKDEFLAMLAHELRNPLAPIMNSLALLKHAANDPEVCNQARETMERQLRQLVRITEDLLEVSRISSGKIDLRKESIELARVVQQAKEASLPFYAARGQTLNVCLPPVPIRMTADAARLAQVIGNLLNNASKFSPDGATVDLTVERDADDAVIRVRDSGLGIAGDQLERVFELFTQIAPPLERTEAGLGIGLTLVKNLVEMHGGKVEARSEGIGHGSEFIVWLPIDLVCKQSSAVQTKQQRESPSAVQKILIVDDNRDSASSMARLLEVSGHDTVTAFTGQSAIEIATRTSPQIVLLDIGLPDLNGYEVAAQLRRQFADQGIALVALTGWGQESDKRRSKEAGFDHHLVKPVDYIELKALIGAIASRSK